MADWKKLEQKVSSGTYDEVLACLYSPGGEQTAVNKARERALHVIREFGRSFPENAEQAALFSGPGRTEIGGNHTDHQHGHVLCGSVDLDILACAAPNGENRIRIISEGHTPSEIFLDDLSAREEEKNRSSSFVRGVAAGIRERGFSLKGCDVYMVSDVLSGSGLSSSAAFEVLLGNVFNYFSCGGALDAEEIAKIGQYAENVYFGKPCGLMDQMGSSIGGAVSIDFADPAAPRVKKVEYDFARSGHALCIIDTGSCHSDLTDDYADVTKEMGAVASFFGKSVLREVPEKEFRDVLPELRIRCGDRAVLRAMHFYDDDRMAQEEAEALTDGDFDRFLSLVRASGLSSALHLQNLSTPSDSRQQAIPLAIALAEKLLDGTGAVRVHGGGFAGTIQAFVPEERLGMFRSGMDSVFGEGHCHVLHIRSLGGCVLLP